MILAIVGAVSRPHIGSFLQSARLDQAARRVVLDLRMAQSQALRSQSQIQVVFEPAADRYSIPEMIDPLRKRGVYRVRFDVDTFGDIDLVSSDFGGRTDLTFDSLGVPTSGGTIVLRLGDDQKTVTLNANTGFARIDE